MQDIGQQYPKDDLLDKTGFLKKARLHQSRFRAEILNCSYDTYGNFLKKEDGEKGKNFFEGFDILQSVNKYRKYNKQLYSNMLRSEHIPFNLFIPFGNDKSYLKNVFNVFLDNAIITIDRIEIEYAPKPKQNYLDDATSFDVYVEYTHSDSTKGILGIEVKYTERDYTLGKNSKQEREINSQSSRYYSVTESCKIYKPEAIDILPTDRFRQVWRNHSLGESILLANPNQFKHFTSITLFPEGNSHFVHTSADYIKLLIENKNAFLPLTYEDFFLACYKYCPDAKYNEWLDYLTKRYIVVT